MAGDLEDQDWARLGVAAALGREYAADAREFLPFLARLLQEAMPGEAEVRTTGLFKKRTTGVTLNLGGARYTVDESREGRLVPTRVQVVRGIALKTEEMPMAEWLAEVVEALETRAGESAQARAALARTLGLE